MPFGLRNAPAVFQRKMDQCFRGTEDFIAVYIDDILVFSPDMKSHAEHLRVMLEICRKNGLILSPTKMKVAVKEVDFLGATIADRKLTLRSWLGVINYARAHIPKCGTLLGPLYQKVGAHGDKRWTDSDWKLVAQIKDMVQKLPDLELPPKECHIILETDGCMEGWGGICKWAPYKGAPKGKEKVCAYASGKFPNPKSTIDAEIYAVMETMESLKIYYLDQKEITIRTDCQAIISFHDKQSHKKPSRVRWMLFCDYITGTGICVKFEHIKGEDNHPDNMQPGGSSGDVHGESQGDLVVYPDCTPGISLKARPSLVLRPNGTTVYPSERAVIYNPDYFRQTKGVIVEYGEPPTIQYEPTKPIRSDRAEELGSLARRIKEDAMEDFRTSLASIEWILRKEADFCRRISTKDNWAGDVLPKLQLRQQLMEDGSASQRAVKVGGGQHVARGLGTPLLNPYGVKQ
ncbi:hypothetical protein I3760_01G013500 [Carya illinoinensis]|nr:hypothetical protein I3760_01G013500 [Carya illinoinensis]